MSYENETCDLLCEATLYGCKVRESVGEKGLGLKIYR